MTNLWTPDEFRRRYAEDDGAQSPNIKHGKPYGMPCMVLHRWLRSPIVVAPYRGTMLRRARVITIKVSTSARLATPRNQLV